MMKKLLMVVVLAVAGMNVVFAADKTPAARVQYRLKANPSVSVNPWGFYRAEGYMQFRDPITRARYSAEEVENMPSIEVVAARAQYRLKANPSVGVKHRLGFDDKLIYRRADNGIKVSAEEVENMPPIDPVSRLAAGGTFLKTCLKHGFSTVCGERSNMLTMTAAALWMLYTGLATYRCLEGGEVAAYACPVAARQLLWTIPAWGALVGVTALGNRLFGARAAQQVEAIAVEPVVPPIADAGDPVALPAGGQHIEETGKNAPLRRSSRIPKKKIIE